MKKIVLAICLVSLSFSAEAKEKPKMLSWNEMLEEARPKNKKKTSSPKAKKASGWSFFWNAFKFKDTEQAKIEFETGVLAYTTKQTNWRLTRLEPFMKIKLAILEKYLQPYIIFAVDKSTVDYQLSNFYAGSNKISVTASAVSSANPSIGGGLRFFVIGWRWFNLYGYMQAQMSSLNDAVLENMTMTINGTEFDIMEITEDHIDINYNIRRYDVGAIITYQPFGWWTISASVGHIWFNANIKLNMDEELANIVGVLTKASPRDVIPKRLAIDEKSAFGILGLKFRIYKRLHVNLEGTMVPSKYPIYFGLASLIIEGNK
ncbi:hypothetical protein KJ885_06010 [Patescibacteria group bacterium]|nr:hypothetical protein [Patescibacteria group bacterium]